MKLPPLLFWVYAPPHSGPIFTPDSTNLYPTLRDENPVPEDQPCINVRYDPHGQDLLVKKLQAEPERFANGFINLDAHEYYGTNRCDMRCDASLDCCYTFCDVVPAALDAKGESWGGEPKPLTNTGIPYNWVVGSGGRDQ